MAQSFRLSSPASPANGTRRRVLVTGAAGRIGAYFAEHSHQRYQLRLMVHRLDEQARTLEQYGELVAADLQDLAQLKQHCRDIDVVVHLAGNPDPNAVWDDLLQNNIVGTYNIFVAAKAAGCKRMIYASSIHAVSGYPNDVQVKTNEPVNPGDMYGVTKCFGEALSRYMAEQEGLPTIAIRIGAFQPIEAARDPGGVAMLDAFVSQRDLNQLIQRAIEAEHVQFAILNGLSNNRFKRLDISDARVLVGYAPEDDLAEHNPRLRETGITDMPQHNVADNPAQSGLRNDL